MVHDDFLFLNWTKNIQAKIYYNWFNWISVCSKSISECWCENMAWKIFEIYNFEKMLCWKSFRYYYFFLRVALTGPRSVAINSLHPCSHWPLFAIAPTQEWIGNGANQTCTWALRLYSFTNTGIFEEDLIVLLS